MLLLGTSEWSFISNARETILVRRRAKADANLYVDYAGCDTSAPIRGEISERKLQETDLREVKRTAS
jgi:hypothetical protein